jgi:hypothetical protein
MSTKHTRGPLAVGVLGDYVATKSGHIFTEVPYPESADAEERRANARLIAAAPELLEALKSVIAWAEAYEATGPRAKDQEERCAFARAAIAKAEGK